MSGVRLPRSQWVDDSEFSCCFSCHQSFSYLVRRHHCRQCGFIFCYRCCYETLKLPQFNYDYEVRVCISCMKVAHLISNGLSPELSIAREAASNFADYTAQGGEMNCFLNYGGIETLLFLLSHSDKNIRYSASGAIYNLARNKNLQPILVRKEVLPKLVELAKSTTENSVLLHIASTLYLLCSNDLINEDVADTPGLLLCIGSLLSSNDYDMCLVVARTICSLASIDNLQDNIVFGANGIVKTLLEVIGRHNDLDKYAIKSLRLLSNGKDSIKAKLIQLDCYLSYVLTSFVRQCDAIDIVKDTVAIFSNLCNIEQEDFKLLIDSTLVNALCYVSHKFPEVSEIQKHVVASIYEISQSPLNKLRVLACLNDFVDLVRFPDANIQLNTLRIIETVLKQGVLELMSEDTKAKIVNTVENLNHSQFIKPNGHSDTTTTHSKTINHLIAFILKAIKD